MPDMFPAFIGQMPPAPETNRRYWTMYCRVCGIEERLAAGPDDPALIEHTNAHNARFHPLPLHQRRTGMKHNIWHAAYSRWYDHREAGHRVRAAIWGWVADGLCAAVWPREEN